MRVIAQRLGSNTTFRSVFLSLFTDPLVMKCRALIAFVTLDGLVRTGAEPGGALDTFISTSDRQLHWIVGVDAVTTAEALRCLKNLQDNSGGRCTVRAFSSSPGSLFHPKLFLFENDDATGHVLMGSNNLTPGGLESNSEVAVLLENLSAAEFTVWDAVWTAATGVHTALHEIDEELIARVADARRRDVRWRRKIAMREEEEPEPVPTGTRVLLRYVAKAGGRTSQVHFSIGKATEFFGLAPGGADRISVQMVQPGEPLGRIEIGRRLVFSDVNRNAKIEMDGLRRLLPDDYPARGRAVLLVQEVESGHYRYMVLLPGDPGYYELQAHLDTTPQTGQALKEDILALDQLLTIWPSYPV